MKINKEKVKNGIKIPQASRSECMKISRMLKTENKEKIKEALRLYAPIEKSGQRCGCVQNYAIKNNLF